MPPSGPPPGQFDPRLPQGGYRPVPPAWPQPYGQPNSGQFARQAPRANGYAGPHVGPQPSYRPAATQWAAPGAVGSGLPMRPVIPATPPQPARPRLMPTMRPAGRAQALYPPQRVPGRPAVRSVRARVRDMKVFSPGAARRRSVTVLAVMAVAMSGGLYMLLRADQITPESLFTASVEQSLSTKSFVQKTTLDQGNFELRQDVSNIRTPRISATADMTAMRFKFEGFATYQQSYIRFTGIPSPADAGDGLFRWVRIRGDGSLPSTYSVPHGLDRVFDPHAAMFSQWPLGNFDKPDRQALVDIINKERVYSFDTGSVKTARVGDNDVFVYEVRVNQAGLRRLHEKMAELSDVKPASLHRPRLFSGATTVSVSLGLKDKRLYGLEYKDADGRTVSSKLSQHDTVKLFEQPQTTLQWPSFIDTMSPGWAGPVAVMAALNKDLERRTDATAIAWEIERYFQGRGTYPTLANLKDPVWISANLPQLTTSVTQDPDGKSSLAGTPAKNVYSYQAGTDTSLQSCEQQPANCRYFAVTATLSDGRTYKKGTAGLPNITP